MDHAEKEQLAEKRRDAQKRKEHHLSLRHSVRIFQPKEKEVSARVHLASNRLKSGKTARKWVFPPVRLN